MKEYNELFESFKKLGLNDKRKKYSEELGKIALILKKYLNEINLDLLEMPHNYNNDEKNLIETQMLDINFRDVYILKAEILLLLSKMASLGKEEERR